MEKKRAVVFEETYRFYLKQLKGKDLKSVETVLDVHAEGDTAEIPLFNRVYQVSSRGVTDPKGDRPAFDVCVVLLKYLLMAPQRPKAVTDWIAFRDIPGAAPLRGYFSHEVERFLSSRLSGETDVLRKAAMELNGNPMETALPYDLKMAFQALPRIRLLLLFNDADAEFDAQCSILFNGSAPEYLDPECLAILAVSLTRALNRLATAATCDTFS